MANSSWRYWLSLVLAFIGILTLVMFLLQPSAILVGDIKTNQDAGNFGSYLAGFVGSIFSLAGVFLFFEALMRQQAVFERQQFETRYFELLRIHCNNVDSLHLTYPSTERAMEPSMQGEMRTTYVEIEKSMKGRTLFKSLIKSFNTCYNSVIKQCSAKKNWKKFRGDQYITVVEAIDMAFTHAYLGDYSQSKGDNTKYLESTVKTHLEGKLDQASVSDVADNIRTRTSSHNDYRYGFEANLETYFDHLYYMINFVDVHATLAEHDKIDLIESIRVQLSVYELAALFLYTLSHAGGEWNKSISKGKDHFISKYNLLKNLRADYFPKYNWQEIMVLEKTA